MEPTLPQQTGLIQAHTRSNAFIARITILVLVIKQILARTAPSKLVKITVTDVDSILLVSRNV